MWRQLVVAAVGRQLFLARNVLEQVGGKPSDKKENGESDGRGDADREGIKECPRPAGTEVGISEGERDDGRDRDRPGEPLKRELG